MRMTSGLADTETNADALSPLSCSGRDGGPFTVAVVPLTMPVAWSPPLPPIQLLRLHRVLMAPSPVPAASLMYLPDTMDSVAGSLPPLAFQKAWSGLIHTVLPIMTIWNEP